MNLTFGTFVGFKAVLTFLIASSKFSSSCGTPLSFFKIPKAKEQQDVIQKRNKNKKSQITEINRSNFEVTFSD